MSRFSVGRYTRLVWLGQAALPPSRSFVAVRANHHRPGTFRLRRQPLHDPGDDADRFQRLQRVFAGPCSLGASHHRKPLRLVVIIPLRTRPLSRFAGKPLPGNWLIDARLAMALGKKKVQNELPARQSARTGCSLSSLLAEPEPRLQLRINEIKHLGMHATLRFYRETVHVISLGARSTSASSL
jgi:hypothetical protein